MYVIQTFIIRCIVSEILAEIDHKCPNWTFLTLKMTFRVIPYLSYFRAGLVSQDKRPLGLTAPLSNCLYYTNDIYLSMIHSQMNTQ